MSGCGWLLIGEGAIVSFLSLFCLLVPFANTLLIVVRNHWNHNRTAEEGVAHLLEKLQEGRGKLRIIAAGNSFEIPEVPGAKADESFKGAGIPWPDDPYVLSSAIP